MDYAVLDPLHAFGVTHPAWVQFWDVFCTVFSPEGFRLLGAVAVVVAVLRRNLRVILFLLTTIGLSGVLAQVAKDLVDRPRPVGALAASFGAQAAALSVPRLRRLVGHALGAGDLSLAAAGGLLPLLLIKALDAPRRAGDQASEASASKA